MQVGSPGVGTTIVFSALGLSDEALSTGAGVMGSCLATSNMSRSSKSPPQVWSEASGGLLHCSAEHPWGYSGMNDPPLEGHGLCHHFFALHHSIILGSLELSQCKIVISCQHPQAGWSRPQFIFFLLCSWQPEHCSLLAGHPFELGIPKALVPGAQKRSELSPPFWHSSILLQVGRDPLACMVWVSPNLSLGFLCLLGIVATQLGQDAGNGAGEVLVRLVCLVGSTNSEISGHSRRQPGTL